MVVCTYRTVDTILSLCVVFDSKHLKLKILKASMHILIIVFLTLLTQVGGIIWLINFGVFKLLKRTRTAKFRLILFLFAYLFCSIFLVPPLATLNNRYALPVLKKGKLIPHNYITPILNRHYVRKDLKSSLLLVASKFEERKPGIRVAYLDACFPFIKGFPLLPHLSHKDGRKVDLSFYYSKNSKLTNLKPSRTGYGNFVNPKKGDLDQTRVCKAKGNWQYDFTKYLSLGRRGDLLFDPQATKYLIGLLLEIPNSQKIFIEPYLKTQMSLNQFDKIRFHGCRAVRHDDHIHLQID